MAAAWLPVLDGLERALEHADADPEAIVAGVRAVRDQAIALLTALGYPRQDEVGVPFDAAVHEAIAAVPDSDAPPGTVLRVVRPGYAELRPAAVTVSQRD
jgi:molecular chaperone GrpE